MNAKAKGEKGERIAIGEFAKCDIDVAIPLSDNLPWDFIVVYNGKLLRAQVKSSTQVGRGCSGSVSFDLTSNNWNQKTIRKYDAHDCDIMVLCDYEHIYILGPKDFTNRKSFTIRHVPSKSNQRKGVNFHSDYVLSRERMRYLLDISA